MGSGLAISQYHCYHLNIMARPLRIEYPGAVYHLTARGNRQEDIFVCDEDRQNFLQILGKTVFRYNWICHAYCLMNNHYHLLIETPDANLSLGMRQLNGMYTQFSNRSHKKVGHVFQGRFKSILVERDSYLLQLCRYIICNPVKAGMCKKPGQWHWSSYTPTASGKNVPDFLTVDWVLSQFSKKKKSARKKYIEFVTKGLLEQLSPWKHVTGQVILGSKEFVEEMQIYQPTGNNLKEIPRIQRVAGRPTLAKLFPASRSFNKAQRNRVIYEAHLDFCYTLKEIADRLGIHYTTVSRVISSNTKK
jgi:putative transposase